MNDGVDGEIYCKSCHNGKFGMTGYGYGLGAGTLLSVRLALLGKYLSLTTFRMVIPAAAFLIQQRVLSFFLEYD